MIIDICSKDIISHKLGETVYIALEQEVYCCVCGNIYTGDDCHKCGRVTMVDCTCTIEPHDRNTEYSAIHMHCDNCIHNKELSIGG